MRTPTKRRGIKSNTYRSPSAGIRPKHLPAYDGDSITPKKWKKMLKKINTPRKSKSNSTRKHIKNLIYRDKGVRKSITDQPKEKFEEKENKPVQKPERHIIESPPPYLKKHKRGMHGLEGLYDDYKDRMKYIGNAYMYESIGKSKKEKWGNPT